jgi:ATP-dependent helicase HrpB
VTVELPHTGLPVEGAVDDVRAALRGHGTAVLQAEPGAGKTTVVPLRLLDEPWRGDGRIVVLEPRRLAARAAARRMAQLLGEEVGGTVGYRTRDERRVGRGTRVEVVTEGILTRRLQADPSLPGTALVVLDEVHERHLQTDLALALTLDARAGLRPDLRVLAMSATPDAGRLARVLGDAPGIASEGRTFPVDVRWRPDRPVEAVVHEALADDGDVLVFLPGIADIRRVAGRLPGVAVRVLHGSLPAAEQDLALSAGGRRVELSTDIAESSLTVEGIGVVVDAGLVRRPRYDARSGLSRLQTTKASRASAEQRAGRAGRLGPGVAYRLWSAAEHAQRRAHPVPEILSADLAGFALELAAWGSDDLAFLDPPPPAALAEARALLTELGALDDGRLTATGRAMLDLPLHPRLARMVVESGSYEACRLAAQLEEPGTPEHERRRAKELARRAGIDAAPSGLTELGPTMALAYTDRIAPPRGRRYVLPSRRGVIGPEGGPPFLVVADLAPGDGDDRIRLAEPLDEADVEAFGPTEVTELRWNDRDQLEEVVERRLDALVLSSRTRRPEPGPATEAALRTRLDLLAWTPAALALQARVAFARRVLGDDWPDLDDAVDLTGVTDLRRVDVLAALRSRLGHRIVELDRLVPTKVKVASGREVAVDYTTDPPSISVRAQELYGTTVHPTVAGVALTVEVLSPASRPIQVTADLPGFWSGSWAAVRKDMISAYPKHAWPADPSTAEASTKVRRTR